MQIRSNNNRKGAWSVSKVAGAFLGSLGMLTLAISSPAANVTTSVQQAAGAHWETGAIWSDGLPPSVGKTYEVLPGGNPSRVRPPTTLGAGVDVIFHGDSLTIDAGAEIRWKRAGSAGAHIIFPGVGGNPGLILNGGNLTPGDATAPGAFHIDGVILVQSASTLDDEGDNNRIVAIDAEIRGSAMLSIVEWTPGANPLTINHANNPFSGTWNIGQGPTAATGASLKATAVGSLGTGDILVAPSATLEINYDINTPGLLRLNETHNGGGGVYGVFILHQNCTFGNVIINGTSLAPGVYTYAALNAAYPNNIPAGGSGQITVTGNLHLFPTTSLKRFLNVGPNRFGYEEAISSDPAGENYVITGGGDDQWDRGDAMAFAYHEIGGDFDIRVQVAGHTKSAVDGCCPKAAIMARDSLAEDAKHVMVSVGARNMNNNLGEFLWRTGIKDVNGHDGGQFSVGAVGTAFPNNWIRLTRVGTVLNGYRGNDQNNWTLAGSIDSAGFANGPLKNRLFVGLTVSKHDGPDGETSRAVFEHYSEASGPAFILQGAESHGQPKVVRAYFTHAINFATLDPGALQFNLSGGLFVSAAAPGSTPNTVDITLDSGDSFVEGTSYTLALNDATLLDTAGNPVAAGPTPASWKHGEGYESKKIHLFHNADGNQELGDNFDYYNQTTAVIQGYGAEIDIFVPHNDGLLDAGSGLHVFEGETGSGQDNLGTRLVGVLYPTLEADYIFATATDDTSNLYLSSDDQPSHQNMIARIPQWAGSRNYTGGASSSSIHLLAGVPRLLDLVSINGGGGFNTAVTWNGPTPQHAGTGNPIANGDLPIAEDQFLASRLANGRVFYTLGPATVSSGPANKTSSENLNVTFSASYDGTPPYDYQWYTNAPAQPPHAVTGATGPTLTLPNVQGFQNNLHVSVCVSNIGGGSCSPDAVLTVIANPVLTAVGTRGNCHALYLTFTKNVLLPASYALDGGISVTSSNFGVNNREVVLHLSPDVVPDITYTLTITGLKSFDNFIIAPNPTIATFVHGAEFPLAQPTQGEASKLAASQFPAGINYKRWNGFDSFGANAAGRPGFLDAPAYLTQVPDISSNGMERFEGPWTNDAEHYGDEFSGLWQVPRTGTYRFWCASDDQSMTFIATDGIPANMVPLCSEPQWVNLREFLLPTANGTAGRGDPPINRSIAYNLTAGQVVYLQADHSEGTGGDNYSLTYAFGRVSAQGQPFTTLCDVFCNPGPSSQLNYFGRQTTFTVVPDGTPPYTIQWSLHRPTDGVGVFNDIPGANGTSYTTPPAAYTDDGNVYKVTISNFFSSTSCQATLTIGHNPIVVSAETRGSPNVVYVTYNKPVQVGTTANYSFPNEPTLFVDDVQYANPADHTVIAVTNDGLPPGTTHLFRITGVLDEEASNPVVPDPTDVTIVQSTPTRLFADFSGGIPVWTTVGGNVAPHVGPEKSLHLTERGATSQQNSWTIPLGGVQLVTTLQASWTSLLDGPIGNAADGYSFSAGQDLTFPVAAEEGSAQGLSVTVDTFNNGGNETGIEVRWNGARLAFTPIGGGGVGSVNGPAELERNIFVPVNLSVDAVGHVIFNYDTYQVVADIPGYAGINVNQYVFYARTGGAAESAWIDDVNINDEGAVLGPPVMNVTPTDSPHSVQECTSLTLVSSGGGSPPLTYQWYRNGSLLPGAVCPTYVTPVLLRGPDVTYSLKVSNRLSVVTIDRIIHVVPDSTPPVIQSVGSLNGSSIGVRFSKAVDLVTGTDPTKYNVDGRGAGVSISGITVAPGGTTVVINVTAPVGCTFSVSETGVLDACPGLDSTTSSAIGHTASLATQDIGISGDPAPEGTTTVFGDGSFEMTAGGSDIWGTDDHGRFTYTTLVDSFDVQVKVVRLDFLNTWSKAGIMARVTLVDNAPTINTYFTPTLGANGIEAGARTTFGGGTGAWGAGGCGGPGCDLVDTPWIRLQRIHNADGSDQFIGSHAPDSGGSPGAWVSHADTGVLPAGAIPDSMFVGLMLTSHNNGNATTADYKGLSIAPGGPLTVTLNGLGQPVVSWTGCTSRLQGTPALIGNAGNNSTWTDIPGASPRTVTNPSLKYFRTINP